MCKQERHLRDGATWGRWEESYDHDSLEFKGGGLELMEFRGLVILVVGRGRNMRRLRSGANMGPKY